MTLGELSKLVDSGVRGTTMPTRIWLEYEDWNDLRLTAGGYAFDSVPYPHFIWKGVPVTFFEAYYEGA